VREGAVAPAEHKNGTHALQSVSQMDQRKPAIFALIALLVALAVAISWTLWKGRLVPEKVGITKGVAVLPFENLSPDPDNAYFAEGIHEEILARLALIHDLKVISRNSTQQYQDKSRNLTTLRSSLAYRTYSKAASKRRRSSAGQRAVDYTQPTPTSGDTTTAS
jgi:hypothetical protein